MSRKYLSSFVAIVATLILASCSKEGKETPSPTPPTPSTQPDKVSVKGYSHIAQEDTIVMHPNVINVQEDINNQFSSITPEGTLVYNETSALDKVHVGDILYSSGADAGSHAYARKVVSIEKRGGKVYYQTEQASITEVFKNVDTSQEYQVDFDKIELYDPQEQIDKLRAAKYGRAYAERMRALEGSISHKMDRTSVKIGYKKNQLYAEVKTILWDRDGDIEKTEDDQLVIKATIEPSIPKIHWTTSYLPPALNAKIVWPMDIPIELSYGIFHTEMSKEKKASWAEASVQSTQNLARKMLTYLESNAQNKDLKKAINNSLKDIRGGKLLLCSVPLTSVTPSSLVLDLRLDIFLILDFELGGEVKLSCEINPTIKGDISFTPIAPYMLPRDVGVESQFKDVELSGEVEAKAKVGLNLGLGIYSKAFGKKPISIELEDQSRIGIGVDVYLGGDLKAKMSYSLNEEAEDLAYGTVAGTVGLYADCKVDARIFFWSLAEPFKGELKINDKPLQIFGPLSLEGGVVVMQEGETHKISLASQFFSWSGNANPETRYVSSHPDIVAIKTSKPGELTLQAKKQGTATIELNRSGGNLSLGYGAYRVIVYKSYKRHGAVQVDNSQGTEI